MTSSDTMRKPLNYKALITLMRAHGVCPQCARPVLLTREEQKNKAWGHGGCCKACRDGIQAALSAWPKLKAK